MGSGPNFTLLHKRDPYVKDHYTDRLLKDFSLSNDEFAILEEVERVLPLKDVVNTLGGAERMFGQKYEGVLYYLRGLKRALDIVVETPDGYALQCRWQASLY